MSDPSPSLAALDAGAADADKSFGARPADEPVVPCQQTSWIEVELLEQVDDVPIAGHPYWIKLPGGEVRRGKLNQNGFVRLDAIPGGICVVRFPGVGEMLVETNPAKAAMAQPWLEIELLDSDGSPVAGERYAVTLPNGMVRTGTLNRRGFARLETVVPGACKVRFPDRQAGDVESGDSDKGSQRST